MWEKILYSRTGHRRRYSTAHVHCILDNDATNTHSECVILITFPLQLWLHRRLSM